MTLNLKYNRDPMSIIKEHVPHICHDGTHFFVKDVSRNSSFAIDCTSYEFPDALKHISDLEMCRPLWITWDEDGDNIVVGMSFTVHALTPPIAFAWKNGGLSIDADKTEKLRFFAALFSKGEWF